MAFLSNKYYDPYSDTMDDDFFPSLKRPSVIANEDDFDYALELEEDDEYRLVAKTLSEVIGFDDFVIPEYTSKPNPVPAPTTDTHNDIEMQAKNILDNDDIEIINDDCAQPSRESSLDSSSKDKASQSSGSIDSTISYSEFLWRMGLLQKQKTWVDSVRRRSSLNFLSQVMLSEKALRDQFLVMMASGVHVRRHQAHHSSELVRLSSNDGMRTVNWSKPRPLELIKERQKRGVDQEALSPSSLHPASYDREGFDCCITICGCGDDLLAGNDHSHRQSILSTLPHSAHTSPSKPSPEDIDSDHHRGRCFHNFGFQHSGQFSDTDIVTIHPAVKVDPTVTPDPTNPQFGTESLRSSKDTYNDQYTFSVIYRRTLSSQGYQTLDIECDNVDTYHILLRGFYMLRDEAADRRKEIIQNYQESLLAIQHTDCLTRGYQLFANIFKREEVDPVSALFEANRMDGGIDSGLGIFSALLGPLEVGGGQSISDLYPSQEQWLDPQKLQASLPPAQFLGWKSAGTQIWARLTMAGLDTRPVFSWDLKRVILKVRAPQWRLEEVAEKMHLRLRNRDGTMRRFRVSRRDTFVALGGDGTIFRSSERQQIIDHILRSSIKDGGAGLGEGTALGNRIVRRFPLHMQSRLRDLSHKWVTFWKIEPPGHVPTAWSLLSTPLSVSAQKIMTTAKHIYRGILRQPLDHVAEYFGEEVAFYFAFLAFSTRWLIVPSFLGFIVFCFQVNSQNLDHWLCIPFAISVMVWASFLLAYWRQKSSALAYRWGVLDYEVEETERPQFYGKYEFDESSGEVRKVYSQWRRLLKYLVTVPIIAAITGTTLVVMATIFSTQDQLYNNYAHREPLNFHPRIGISALDLRSAIHSVNHTSSAPLRDPWGTHISSSDLQDTDFWIVTILYPCIYGILVDIAGALFSLIAIHLTDFENHRTSSLHATRLVLKLFSFQAVTTFTSLFYYAFSSKRGEASYLRMSVTIFSLMTVGQWYGAIMDIFLPSLYHRIRKYNRRMSLAGVNRGVYKAREYLDHGAVGFKSDKEVAKMQVEKRADLLKQARERVWEEALLPRYSTTDDYTDLSIQLGLVLLFSIVMPLAPLILLINNVILMRIKAVKVCYFRQRPVATKVSGLGVWEDLLQLMSTAGIITSCAIMAFTSLVLTNSSFGQRLGQGKLVLLLFSLEHFLLLFKYWLNSSIPRVPPSVLRAKNRDHPSLGTGVHNKANGGDGRSKKRKSSASFPKKRESLSDEYWKRGNNEDESNQVKSEVVSIVPFKDAPTDPDSDSAVVQTNTLEESPSMDPHPRSVLRQSVGGGLVRVGSVRFSNAVDYAEDDDAFAKEIDEESYQESDSDDSQIEFLHTHEIASPYFHHHHGDKQLPSPRGYNAHFHDNQPIHYQRMSPTQRFLSPPQLPLYRPDEQRISPTSLRSHSPTHYGYQDGYDRHSPTSHSHRSHSPSQYDRLSPSSYRSQSPTISHHSYTSSHHNDRISRHANHLEGHEHRQLSAHQQSFESFYQPTYQDEQEPLDPSIDDDASLSSAESTYDSGAHANIQQLLGARVSDELGRRDKNEAWSAYIASGPTSQRTSPQSMNETSSMPKSRQSLLQFISEAVWGSPQPSASEQATASPVLPQTRSPKTPPPLPPRSRSPSPHSYQPSRSDDFLASQPSFSPSYQNHYPHSLSRQPDYAPSFYREEFSTAPYPPARDERFPPLQHVGGNISMHSDLYRQAQTSHAKRTAKPSKKIKSPSPALSKPQIRSPTLTPSAVARSVSSIVGMSPDAHKPLRPLANLSDRSLAKRSSVSFKPDQMSENNSYLSNKATKDATLRMRGKVLSPIKSVTPTKQSVRISVSSPGAAYLTVGASISDLSQVDLGKKAERAAGVAPAANPFFGIHSPSEGKKHT